MNEERKVRAVGVIYLLKDLGITKHCFKRIGKFVCDKRDAKIRCPAKTFQTKPATKYHAQRTGGGDQQQLWQQAQILIRRKQPKTDFADVSDDQPARIACETITNQPATTAQFLLANHQPILSAIETSEATPAVLLRSPGKARCASYPPAAETPL